ncbi:DUF4148 domain-containing protein [Burkholderia perseverans]|uniref:DUF4148 domain-containing protein n=1 Tax=Burkholderia perseverans TaxID=2615214 RepID=UPI001FEEB390|nr:DUF4148 domain-containing protein [Burkholderia perseverans]
MKNLIQAVAVAAALVVPVASFAQAQSNGPVTRAQVRAELVQLEQTGWRPSAGADTRYPADIQAAEHQVAAVNGVDTSGYGGVSNATQSGSRPVVSKSDWDAMYRHP